MYPENKCLFRDIEFDLIYNRRLYMSLMLSFVEAKANYWVSLHVASATAATASAAVRMTWRQDRGRWIESFVTFQFHNSKLLKPVYWRIAIRK